MPWVVGWLPNMATAEQPRRFCKSLCRWYYPTVSFCRSPPATGDYTHCLSLSPHNTSCLSRLSMKTETLRRHFFSLCDFLLCVCWPSLLVTHPPLIILCSLWFKPDTKKALPDLHVWFTSMSRNSSYRWIGFAWWQITESHLSHKRGWDH